MEQLDGHENRGVPGQPVALPLDLANQPIDLIHGEIAASSDIEEGLRRLCIDEECDAVIVCLVGLKDAEQALSQANEKFERRFRLMEKALRAAGHEELNGLSLQQLDAAWEGVKRDEAGT